MLPAQLVRVGPVVCFRSLLENESDLKRLVRTKEAVQNALPVLRGGGDDLDRFLLPENTIFVPNLPKIQTDLFIEGQTGSFIAVKVQIDEIRIPLGQLCDAAAAKRTVGALKMIERRTEPKSSRAN